MSKKFRIVFCIALLCFQCIPFSLVFAETIEDTPTSETASSAIQNDPLKATNSIEEQKQPIDPQVEEPVLSYEDQTFLEQENPDSVIPAVLLDEKNLNKDVLFRGKVTAGSEKQGAHRIVKMKSLILQRAKDDTDWEDHHVFTVDSAGVNLTATDYMIDFSETVDDPGSYPYRLIMDYEVESFEGDKLIGSSEKKGSLELGLVEVVEETKEELNPVEVEDSSAMETAESDKSTSNSVAEPTVESEEKNTADEQNETKEEKEEEPLAPPPLEASPSMVPSKAASQELPELQDNYRQAFQRGMGIMPLASNNAVIKSVREDGITATVPALSALSTLTISELKYTSKTQVRMVLQFTWYYQEMNKNGTEYVDYEFQTSSMGTYLTTYRIKSHQYLTKARMQTMAQGSANLGNITNTARRENCTYNGNTYSRIFNTTSLEWLNLPADGNVFEVHINSNSYGFTTGTGGTANNYASRTLRIAINPANFVDLSNVSNPTFEYITVPTTKPAYYQYVNPTEMNLKPGTYAGDVYGTEATRNAGRLILYNPDNTEFKRFTNIPHTTTRNGTYAASKYKLTGLQPGAQYKARMYLLSWPAGNSDWTSSANDTTIYTPNTVNAITANPVLNTPTTANNATIQLTGTYNANGKTPAHPRNTSDMRVRYRVKGEDDTKWRTDTNVTKNSVNTSNKNVVFTINALVPYTTYQIEYSVRNASNQWSAWSAIKEVTTNGVALEVSKPELDPGKVSTPKQLFLNSGNYLGNVSTYNQSGVNYNNTGRVEIRDYNIGNYVAKTVTLKHTNYLGTTTKRGQYDPYTISDLTAGSRYQVRVGLRKTNNTYQYSAVSDFYTPNTVNAIPNSTTNPELSTPTTANNATAKFTGTYNAAGVGTTVPAHPRAVSDIGVRYRKKGDTDWRADNAPKNSVNTSTKSVVFTINSLAPKTTYEMQYAVRNASGIWSAWSAMKEFTTKGIAPTISPPVFDQATATSSTIQMKPGTYKGDVSQAGNTGEVCTESYNETGNGGTKDWILRANITHDTTTDGNYSGALITGLDAGTRYRGWVRMKDYEGNYTAYVMSTGPYFYTTNTVAQPSVTSMGTPTTPLDASVSFSGQYVVGTKTGQVPIHPDQVKVRISLDNMNWIDIDSSTIPKLTATNVNKGSKSVGFSLGNLKTNTKYYVQYRVKNQGGWSEWSVSEDFTTAAPPAGIYLLEHPMLDFGTLEKELFSQTANLSTDSVKNHVVIDNTLTSSGWTLSAKLENLARTTDASVMPWATLRMDINLQQTTDNGANWNDYTTGVTGVPRTLTLNAGDPAQNLWSISNAADAQGTFRNEIDWTSVELDVPANQEGYYQGKLVWSLDSIP